MCKFNAGGVRTTCFGEFDVESCYSISDSIDSSNYAQYDLLLDSYPVVIVDVNKTIVGDVVRETVASGNEC